MESVPDRYPAGFLASAGRRVGAGLLTALAAVSLTFFALRLVGGDPTSSLLSQSLASPDQVEAIRTEYGLDRPLHIQYMAFLLDLAHGDLGRSIYTGQSVSQVIGSQLGATLELATLGLILALLMGFGLGILAAWSRSRSSSAAGRAMSGLATALPVAFTGLLAILVVTLTPLRQVASGTPIGYGGLVLPSLVLGFATCGAIARSVQTELAQSAQQQYFTAATARGLRRSPRLLWHALRPALPVVISVIALQAAHLFAGTVVTETVFARPGIGRLLVTSILQGDFAVAQGLVVLAALIYTLTHLVADILTSAVDPRLRGSQ
jgi:ABC-type dipeptide/oligopeptide/nickel transport system permease component